MLESGDKMPISVNGSLISDHQVHEEMQYHEAESIDEARYLAAQSLVIRKLFIFEAAEQKIIEKAKLEDLEEEEIDAAIDELITSQVSVPEADQEICEFYYKQNLERFTDLTTGKILPFDLVLDKVRDYMHARSLRSGVVTYITMLATRSKIEGFEMELN